MSAPGAVSATAGSTSLPFTSSSILNPLLAVVPVASPYPQALLVDLLWRAVPKALMLALVIVEAEPGANAGLGLGDRRIGIEVDFLVFEAPPHRSTKMLSMQRPLPSMLIVISWRFKVPVKSSLVNWLAALVDIEDLGPAVVRECFLERLDTELGAEGVRQPPPQHGAARPVHDDHQIEEALGHWDVGDVRTPNLIDPFDHDAAKQVRVDFVRRGWLSRCWA